MRDRLTAMVARLVLPGGCMPELLGQDAAQFRAEHEEALRRPIRFALVVGLAGLPLFAMLDYFVLPQSWQIALLVRVFLQVLPIAAALWWMNQLGKPPAEPLLTACGIAVNSGIAVIVALAGNDEPGRLAYQFGLLLMPLTAVAVAPVQVTQFLLVVVTSIAMAAALIVADAGPVTTAASVLNIMILALVGCVGAVVLVSREAQARDDFLQRRLLSLERDAFASANEELTRARDQLVQAEKLVALGGLLASIAHQINTPVGNAVTGASLLKQRVDDLKTRFEADDLGVEDLQRFLCKGAAAADLVLQGCQRAAGLIEGFKQVAMDAADDDRRIFALRLAVEDAHARLRSKLDHLGVSVAVDAAPGVTVEGYRGLIATAARYLLEVMADSAGERSNVIVLRAALVDHDVVELVAGAPGQLDRTGVPPGGLDALMMAFPEDGSLGLSLHVLHACVTGPMAGRMEVVRHAAGGLPTVAILFPRIAPQREI